MRQPWRLGERGRRWLDRGLVLGLLLPVLAMAVSGLPWTVILLCTLQIAPLWWRRTHPVPVAAFIAAACLLQLALIDEPIWGQLAAPIAIYSAARYAPARWGLIFLAAGIGGAAMAPFDWFTQYGIAYPTDHIAYFLTISTIAAAAWAFGTLGRTRTAYIAGLVERSERIEREAAQQATLAAQDERARIAREMHDVVAHGLSVIVVQADGARYAADRDPSVAAAALETISETGREALGEMRRMLGLLRASDTGTAPQPGLEEIRHLVHEAVAGGMDLQADLPDPLPEVADGVGLTAYRLVQEALTNVRKHAGPAARVRLLVLADGATLRVAVTDDGRGAAAGDDGAGLGLLGMRERVTAYGGTLTAAPRPGGGFGVDARIPL